MKRRLFSRRFLIFPVALIVGGLALQMLEGHEARAVPHASSPFAALAKFSEILQVVQENYVDDVAEPYLIKGAINGMLESLDPHSSYMDTEEFKEMQVETKGEFGGLGIEVTMENGVVKVVSPIEDTPAFRAGVQTGDLIIKLDTTAVRGMTLNEAVSRMRGKPGSTIVLTVVRQGASSTLEIPIIRDVIKIHSVKGAKMEAPGIGYVRITNFQSHTTEDLQKAIEGLKKEAGGKLDGLVLDLRNNPGGLLNQAVGVSDLFLNEGVVVSTRTREGEVDRMSANPGDILDGAPMVVLINGGSASASEIVSGALQDHHRAVLMGVRSFGKGSVQTIMPMSDGSALRLTTARYYTASGRSIQAKGIDPDIEVAAVQAQTRVPANHSIQEADLEGHLTVEGEAGKQGAAAQDAAPQDSDEIGSDGTITRTIEDFQLRRATDLLQGFKAFQGMKPH